MARSAGTSRGFRFSAVVVSCEHAVNRVPKDYTRCFASARARRALESHRGWDIGALRVARRLGQELGAPVFEGHTTRLLADLNRSLGHPALFSEFTHALTATERQTLLHTHYHPYRVELAAQLMREAGAGAQVLHLSVHSFTPTLHGQQRNADLGLLYDPSRQAERAFARFWKQALMEALPQLRIRFNYPYRGTGDGFTTSMRRRLSDESYAGIEVELNQGLLAHAARSRALTRALGDTAQVLLCKK